MSAFSVVERIAVAASRLDGDEASVFEDLFVTGLTAEEVCAKRGFSQSRLRSLHDSMMRSLCGVAAPPGAQSGANGGGA